MPASHPAQRVAGRRLRRTVAVLLLAGSAATLAPAMADAAPVVDDLTFADPVFRTCVAANLGMPPTSPVTRAKAATLTALDCGELSPASLDGAQALTNLTSLSVAYGSTVSDLTPLAGLTNLRELVLPMSKVSDLSPLRALAGLTKLDVYGNPIQGLQPLARLTKLAYLDVTGASWTTLEPLRSMTALRRLSADQEGPVDVAAVGALTALQRLDLAVPGVRDLSPLRNLTALTQLRVQAAATDVAALGPLTRLRTLSLTAPATSGAGLAGKPDLTELSVCGVRLSSLDVLAASTRLTWLVVASSGIRDLSTLRNMTDLQELVVSGVDQADLSPLSRLPQLGYLSVSESRLGPLRQLDGFAALSSLALNDDQLDNLDGFRLPANVTSLDVSGNHLADLSPLRCGVLVNALGQTVQVKPAARVGQPFRLPLKTVTGQTVQLGRSSSWTSTGTSITYQATGTFRVPFVGAGPECAEVQFGGVASQVVVTGTAPRPMRPPRDR